MSANLIVDVGLCADWPTSIVSLSGQSTAVGRIVDLMDANTHTNVWVTANGLSGELPVLIQTADATTSGSFTDPTSGLPTGAFPIGGRVSSGGVFWANSGLYSSGRSSPLNEYLNSASPMASGGMQFASFQRPHRYARLIITSGNASIGNAVIHAGFLAQKKVTGSGGGTSQQPGSGAVSV